MKVLAFTGSPRKGGNTEVLVAAMMSGAARAGCDVETIRLPDRQISPCIGCGGCSKTGHCVINDDMQSFYDKIEVSKAVIIASPIYFYGLSAQTKAFVDRLQALWSRKQLMLAEGRWSPDTGRRGYLVSVAATTGAKLFVGAQLCAQYAFDAMGIAYGGDFLVRGVEARGAIKKRAEKLREAEVFGAAVCRGESERFFAGLNNVGIDK